MVEIYSSYTAIRTKTDGLDTFYAIQRSYDRTMLRSVKGVYISDNNYRVIMPIYELGLKFIHIFSATAGYSVEWYDNTEFRGTPFLRRVENNLMQVASQ